MAKQSVLVVLKFSRHKFDNEKALDAIFDLQDILLRAIECDGLGEFDGNEFCEYGENESVTFFMNGLDAHKIYDRIKPILDSLPSISGSYVVKYFGDAESVEEKILLK